MIIAFRANTPLMIFRQTSLVSNSYGSTTVTAPPCTAGSLRLTSRAGTALELGRPKSATLSKSRQGLVVLAHRGPCVRQPGLRMAVLDQARVFGGAATAWDAAASGYGDLVSLEHRLSRQAARLAELGDRVTAADLERFGRDQEQFAHAGGYG